MHLNKDIVDSTIQAYKSFLLNFIQKWYAKKKIKSVTGTITIADRNL